VGLFGAIGRETKGAVRSLGYDLRRSKRFRRVGVIAVATVAGGVIAAGSLVRGEPVPGIPGLGGDDSDIIEGWFGLGADTTGQDAESSEAASTQDAPRGGDAADPNAEASPTGSASQGRGTGSGTGGRNPDLVPIGGDPTGGPTEEESTPTQPPTTEEPTEEPTTEEPTTEEPTQEPTTEAPTAQDPSTSESVSTSASPTDSPSESAGGPVAEQAPRAPMVPVPRKGPVGG
jgi:hypothetical protein